ncbi:MAG TPA: response regulator [Caulobacteraceae bacterium]|jgi:DNA-binding NtrC family response regulator|nr:response regulator [Caulobacteraceae bacterium]
MSTARQPNVLLVDDEALVRETAAERLRADGMQVLEAAAGAQALALLAEHPEIDVLFTDVRMPGGMDGVALACEVRRTHPRLHLILTSGRWTHAGDEVPDGAVFLQKPYSLDAVAQLVQQLVKRT